MSVLGTKSHKAKIFERQRGLCCWCGRALTLGSATIEHIIPLSFGRDNGGTNEYENKAIAHRLCNTRRSNDVTKEPHADKLFDFVRQRLAASRRFWVASPARAVAPAPKPVPARSRIPWSCIILRLTADGWVGMAGEMRKSGRAERLRVTPPYRNRVIALADITGAIR